LQFPLGVQGAKIKPTAKGGSVGLDGSDEGIHGGKKKENEATATLSRSSCAIA